MACNERKDSKNYMWVKKGSPIPPCCLTRLLVLFSALVDKLEEMEVPYSLGGKTLVGAWRYSGLNPWENTITLLYPASLDRLVHSAAKSVSKVTICGAGGWRFKVRADIVLF